MPGEDEKQHENYSRSSIFQRTANRLSTDCHTSGHSHTTPRVNVMTEPEQVGGQRFSVVAFKDGRGEFYD